LIETKLVDDKCLHMSAPCLALLLSEKEQPGDFYLKAKAGI
jgi:hypothetical protein